MDNKSQGIKYRAWKEETKTMIDLYSITPLALSIDEDGLFIPFLDDLILMQYTGYKNLCQKDIIQFPFEHPITGEEEWHYGIIEKDDYGFIVESLDGSSSFALRELDEVIDRIKIRGNIFGDPNFRDWENDVSV